MTMNNNTFYSPNKTEVAIHHHLDTTPHHHHHTATTANFIYFQMMHSPNNQYTSNICQQQQFDLPSPSPVIIDKKQHSFSSGESNHNNNNNNSNNISLDMDKGKDNTLTRIDTFEAMNDEDHHDTDNDDDEECYFHFNRRSREEEDDEDNDDDYDDVPSNVTIPFWYGHEDPEHVEFVMKTYSSFLKLNHKRTPNSRRPIYFIGKIIREAVEDDEILASHSDDDEEDSSDCDMSDTNNSHKVQRVLVTTETLFIYERSQKLEPGAVSKFVCRVVVETMYDYFEGVPINIIIQNENETDITHLDHVTILQCMPSVGLNPKEFQYTSNTITEASQITDMEKGISFADLYSQCLQNSAEVLAKLKPKHNTFTDCSESEENNDKENAGIIKQIILSFEDGEAECENDNDDDDDDWIDI